MSKKIVFILIVILVMSFIISACGNKSSSSSKASETVSSTESSSESTVEESPSESSSPSTSEEISESSSVSPSASSSASPSTSSSVSPSASSNADLQKFDGYLVDVTCGKKGKDEKGNDLTKSPMKHTAACLKSHADSGFGLFRGQSDGTFKFFPLDDDGNKQIKRYIIDKTTKKDDLRIAVRGTLDENGETIHVKIVMAYGLE